jgi:hypothetical protein
MECGTRFNVCVAPQIEDEHGWPSCEPYGTWEDGVQWMEDECIVLAEDTEDKCDSIQGIWTPTDTSKEQCLGKKKCTFNDGWFNDMDETECNLCDGRFKSVNTYRENAWQHGSMRQMFRWKERKWAPRNEWVWEIDRWMVEQTVDDVIRRLEYSAEGEFVQCMYGGMVNNIEKIGCACGKNRDSCVMEEIFGSMTQLVESELYEGIEEIAGNIMATNIAVGPTSIEGNSTVITIKQDMFVPQVSSSEQRRMRGLRKLEAEGSLNSAECSTVVTNENGALVGQLVGNCVVLDISQSFSSPAILCIETKPSIEVHDIFDVAGVASKIVNEDGKSTYAVG